MKENFSNNDEISSVLVTEHEEIMENKTVRVDIKGAVKEPGVYEVSNGSRINDVVNLAGGLKSNASTKYLNLSKMVTDEMVIYVYTSNQIKNMEKDQTVSESCKCETIYINECAGSNIVENGESDVSNKKESSVNSLISINKASKDDLMSLSGIGEAKANSIIEYRNKNGNFKDISEIKNVSGISDSLYEKIKDFITI